MTSLTSPRTRLALASAVVAATAAGARRDRVGPAEEGIFRAVNRLPDGLHRPVWVVMQMGTVGAAPLAAAVAWMEGDRPLAGRLLAAGTATWGLSKVSKRWVGRPRPADLLEDISVRGRAASGLGYLSGHAGVAAALGVAVAPRLGRLGRLLVGIAVPAVGVTRIYVGAHLPLDVVGGAALGVAVETVTGMCGKRGRR